MRITDRPGRGGEAPLGGRSGAQSHQGCVPCFISPPFFLFFSAFTIARQTNGITHTLTHNPSQTEAKEREKELAEQAEKLGETLEEAGIRTRRQKQKGMVGSCMVGYLMVVVCVFIFMHLFVYPKSDPPAGCPLTTQIKYQWQPEEELALVPAMEHDEHEGLDEASLKEHEEVGQ